MVVSFDNEDRNAKLSLRQSEILAKLQTIVDDIADCGCDQYVSFMSASSPRMNRISPQEVGAHVPSGIWAVHARVDPWVAIHG